MRKYLLAALAVLLLVIGAGGYYLYDRFKADPPELSARAGDLTFISDREGTWDIFVLDRDDNLLNLTSDSSGHEYFYSYVFEGDKLNIYTSHSGSITPGVVMADGTDFRALSFIQAGAEMINSGQLDMDPAWSPDGEKLLWMSLRDFNSELYISDSDGSNPRRMTDHGRNDIQQAWSPDGTKVAFVSERNGGVQHVFVMDAATGELTQLSSGDQWDFQPVWSMDGTQILYISDRDLGLVDGVFELYVMNADGTGDRRLAEGDVFTGDPTYSPDGEQVAYMSNEEGRWQIYIQDRDGSNQRRVTDGEANYMYPAWRPIVAGDDDSAASATEAP